jgi:hypothetical protein
VIRNAPPKPERAARKAAKRQQQQQHRLTRAQVRQIVFRRAKERCERCQRRVSFDVAAWRDDRAQINEPQMRSKGANPLDPDQCELVCRACHFGGPSGAHAPTADRMVRK